MLFDGGSQAVSSLQVKTRQEGLPFYEQHLGFPVFEKGTLISSYFPKSNQSSRCYPDVIHQTLQYKSNTQRHTQRKDMFVLKKKESPFVKAKLCTVCIKPVCAI